MSEFGVLLRELRRARGWRQQDLADALAGGFARSTLANVEAGRERPSARLWQLLREHIPAWEPQLAAAYKEVAGELRTGSPSDRAGLQASPRRQPAATPGSKDAGTLGGPFALERLTLAYTFRHSRAPEEIVEIRRVRALQDGASRYGLKLTRVDSPEFTVDEEALFGGSLSTGVHHRTRRGTIYLRRFDFDRILAKGDVHEFGVRSWVAQDPDPDTAVQMDFTMPVESASIHLNFYGPVRPAEVWTFGPIADDELTPTTSDGGESTSINLAGTVSMHLDQPQVGPVYGIAWRWQG
jgi:DNA-binding XRE family transcriptional regulator